MYYSITVPKYFVGVSPGHLRLDRIFKRKVLFDELLNVFYVHNIMAISSTGICINFNINFHKTKIDSCITQL